MQYFKHSQKGLEVSRRYAHTGRRCVLLRAGIISHVQAVKQKQNI